MPLNEISQTLAAGERTSPKTILAFFGVVLGILVTGTIGLTLALARNESTAKYISWVLIFVGAIIVAMLVVIVFAMFRDPTKLMLGQITGREFIDNRRLTLGDSTSGEQTVASPFAIAQGPEPAAAGSKTEEE